MSRYVVQQANPGRLRWIIAVACVVVLLLLVASYFTGQYRSGFNVKSLGQQNTELRSQLVALQDSNQSLRDENALISQNQDMGAIALKTARQELADVQLEMVELREELVFYRSLLKPEDRSPGLHIQALNIKPDEAGQYRYTLVLTQVRQNDRFAEGTVSIGLPKQLLESVDDVSTDAKAELETVLKEETFKFRFFQRIEGTIALPEGVVPEQLLLKVQPKGRRLKGFDQYYQWNALIGGL